MNPAASGNAPAEGGRRRRTKKHGKRGMKSKGASDWNKKVMAMFHKMRETDKTVSFSKVLKICSELKKQGKL
jgi:hypothetical protein